MNGGSRGCNPLIGVHFTGLIYDVDFTGFVMRGANCADRALPPLKYIIKKNLRKIHSLHVILKHKNKKKKNKTKKKKKKTKKKHGR